MGSNGNTMVLNDYHVHVPLCLLQVLEMVNSVKHIIAWSFFAVVIFFRLVSPNQFLFCKGRQVNTSVKMLCIYFHPLGVNRILEAILTLTMHCSPQ